MPRSLARSKSCNSTARPWLLASCVPLLASDGAYTEAYWVKIATGCGVMTVTVSVEAATSLF